MIVGVFAGTPSEKEHLATLVPVSELSASHSAAVHVGHGRIVLAFDLSEEKDSIGNGLKVPRLNTWIETIEVIASVVWGSERSSLPLCEASYDRGNRRVCRKP